MKGRTTYWVLAALVAFFFCACDSSGEDEGEEGESTEGTEGEAEPDLAALLVGTWANDVMPEMMMTFNSEGRVYTPFVPCVGSFTIEGTRLNLNYDEEQPNCSSGGGNLTFDGDDHFSIMSAPYTRIDNTDVTDFSIFAPPTPEPTPEPVPEPVPAPDGTGAEGPS